MNERRWWALTINTDDSAINVTGSQAYGWTSIHLVEPDVTTPAKPASQYQIRDLQELRELFPDFFKKP